MKKILFINGHMNTGGVEKSLLDILRRLDYDSYNVDLLLLEELGDYGSEIPSNVHIHVKSLKNTYGPFLKSLLTCVKVRDWFGLQMRVIFLLMKFGGQRRISLAKKLLTKNQHYDYVIGFRPGICTQIAAFAVHAEGRATWWHHGEINVERQNYLECAEACDKVVAVSRGCSKMLADAFPTIRNKLIVIPNMIDQSYILQKAEEFCPYSRKDVTQIVTLCRLSPEKHIENAIFAAQKLKEAGIAFQWHLVGSGSEEKKLRQTAASAGVADVFLFEGNQANPYPYLKYADLFVHPSYVESQGIVILEAMSLGIPCVVTKSLGPCEFIQDGVNGILTEKDPIALTEEIVHILAEHKLYDQIHKNTCCPPQFRPKRVIKQIYVLFQ